MASSSCAMLALSLMAAAAARCHASEAEGGAPGKPACEAEPPFPVAVPAAASHPRRCETEGVGSVCLVSLAAYAGYEGGSGRFHSRDRAADLCRHALGPDADLASLTSPERARMARELVEVTDLPHWVNGVEWAGAGIEW